MKTQEIKSSATAPSNGENNTMRMISSVASSNSVGSSIGSGAPKSKSRQMSVLGESPGGLKTAPHRPSVVITKKGANLSVSAAARTDTGAKSKPGVGVAVKSFPKLGASQKHLILNTQSTIFAQILPT